MIRTGAVNVYEDIHGSLPVPALDPSWSVGDSSLSSGSEGFVISTPEVIFLLFAAFELRAQKVGAHDFCARWQELSRKL